MWPEVATVEEVEAVLDRDVSLDVVGIKVTIERGWNPLWNLALHPREVREAIRRGAEQRGFPIYVHATSEKDQTLALDMGARALVHPIEYRSAALSDDFVRRMATSGTYQITTFSVFDSALTMYHPERLDDALVGLVVPEVELRSARDPKMGRAMLRSLARDEGPPMPDFLRDAIEPVVVSRTHPAAGAATEPRRGPPPARCRGADRRRQ
jgi:hypothetical protein